MKFRIDSRKFEALKVESANGKGSGTMREIVLAMGHGAGYATYLSAKISKGGRLGAMIIGDVQAALTKLLGREIVLAEFILDEDLPESIQARGAGGEVSESATSP